jgi:hypothetical protein
VGGGGAFSWLRSFLFGALFGGLLLVGLVLFGEVAAVAVGLEPEDGWLDGFRVCVGPGFFFSSTLGEVIAKLFQAGLFGEVEFVKGDEWGESGRVPGVAFGEAVGVRGDLRNRDRWATERSKALGIRSGGALLGEDEVGVVRDAVSNESVDGGKEAEVVAEISLVGLLGDGVEPADVADTLVIDGAAEADDDELAD